MRAIKNLLTLSILFLLPPVAQAQQNQRFLPKRSDATIYQVNIRTFSKEGNLRGVIKRVDSIKNLGINVVYLMPIYPIGKLNSVNSPYCVSDYRSVNPEFGNLADLKLLVETIHQKQMSVILDWVPNHTSYDHIWIKNRSWYLQDSTGRIISPPRTGWRDVAQLNFKNMDMRKEMISSMEYWVRAANVDGFRCDYADGPPFDFWKQAITSLRKIPNHKLLMLAEGKRSNHYQAGFDYNFGFAFFEGMKEIYTRGKSAKLIDSLNKAEHKGAKNGQQIVRYTTNHDVNGSDGTPQELFGGERGAIAAFIVSTYMNSVPLIYNGQEVGTPYRLVFPFTGKNIDWSLNPSLTAEYKKIIALRNKNEALRNGKVKSYATDDICAFIKEKKGKAFFVLSNLRNKPVQFTVPQKLKKQKWTDAFTGLPFKLSDQVVLQPYSYLVISH
ncbi:alpha-amylase family glycosyl hydrolase [Pedobacter miscanthi]|uniref:alpha-amylase family glycosyl hydrolase n=1 Tax=Pedobacter miscanthi TaxID=2259170 RepID=UPI00292F2853|nr:alpha-amylase family glycosyl hydrolase [Pedobacter miscanthi]